MNTTSDTAGRSRRLLLATGLVAAPALMALGIGFEPAVPSDGVATFEVIAGQSGRYYLAVLATIIGLGLLPVVGAAIAVLVQRRGRAAATWAAALFGIGGIAVAVGKGFQIISWLEAAPAAGYREAFSHVGDQVPAGAEVFFIAGTVTLLSAAILAAVALWRSRIVPRWLAAGYGVTWVTGLFFTGDPGAGAGLAVLPLLVVSIPIALVLARGTAAEPAAPPACSARPIRPRPDADTGNVTVRVLLADDHPVVREGLRALIATTGDLEVVAEAGDGREAIRLARQHAPDAVVMDLSMPRLDGAAAAREILAVRPGTGIVILTMHTDDEALAAALQTGATGFVAKDSLGPDVLDAIRAVARREGLLAPPPSRPACCTWRPRASAAPPPRRSPSSPPGNARMLSLVARGLDNNAIARKLVLSPLTARNRLTSILAKLGVTDRQAAAEAARRAGITTPGVPPP